MSLRAATIALAALYGCNETTTIDHSDELGALQAELAAMQERLDQLVATHEADVQDLEQEITAINGGVDLTDLEAGVAQNQQAIVELGDRLGEAEGDLASLDTKVGGYDERLDTQQQAVADAEATVAALGARVTSAEATVTALDSRVDTLEDDLDGYAASLIAQAQAISDLGDELEAGLDAVDATIATMDDRMEPLDYMSVNAGDVVFEGTNVRILSGGGSTDDAGSGLGNLIIGYNAAPSMPVLGYRNGAHNLIIGDYHSWRSYGGIVAGEENTIEAPYAAVLGGSENVASGSWSVVTGGHDNTASADTTVAVGGDGNEAAYLNSVAVGGYDNIASQTGAVAVGGYDNDAGGLYSVVLAGRGNETTGTYSSIAGGQNNLATSMYSAVSGGYYGEAGYQWSTVYGGTHMSTTSAYDVAP